MAAPKSPVHAMRRSTRLRMEMPVHVRSLDPKIPFDADCRTLIVNAQGCGVHAPAELPADTLVMLSIGERQTTGVVLNSTCIGANRDMWVVGIELHESGNFWGLPGPPADWVEAPAAPSAEAAPAATPAKGKAWPFAKKRAAKVSVAEANARASQAAVPAPPATSTAPPPVSSLTNQVTADLQRHSEESMAGLRTRVEELVAHHEAELTARLVEGDRRVQEEHARRAADLQAAADRALQAIEERQTAVAARNAELAAAADAALEAIEARQRELEATLEQRSWDYEAQAEASAEKLQQKLTAALRQLDVQLEQQQAHIRDVVDQRLQSEFEQREQQLKRTQEEVTSAMSTLESRQQQLASQLDHIQQAKSYIESVMATLPATIAEQTRQHAEEMATDAWSGMREQSEKHIADTLQRETQREAEQVREMLGASARQLREDMAAQGQKTAVELQARIAELITQRERDLETRADALAAAADERLRKAERELGSEFTRRVTEQFEKERAAHQSGMEKSHAATEKLFADVADRSDRLLTEVHLSLQQQAKELVEEELARARQEMLSGSAAVRDRELAVMREELERVAAEQVNRAVTAAAEASRSADQLKLSSSQVEAQSQALYQQLETARAWLTEESETFEKNVHDAFLKASGEIRGRAHAAIEMADEFIQQKARETLANLDAATAGQAEHLQQQAAEAESRLQQLEIEAAGNAEAILKSRLAETLEVFHQDAARLAESAIARWQSAMEDTLRAMPDVLRRNLEGEQGPPSRGQGAPAAKGRGQGD